MTDLNPMHINGKDVGKTLDWTYIEWHNEDAAQRMDAQTQTANETTVDRGTQTANPFLLRIELARTPSRLRCGSVGDTDNIRMPLFQFDRQAPARISTSPTLRRMRSTRLPSRDMSRTEEEPDVKLESLLSQQSPLSPHYKKSPLATFTHPNSDTDSDTPGVPESVMDRLKAPDSSDIPPTLGESADVTADDTAEVKEAGDKSRLTERRRSSVVVTIPELDVSPGDLFVSNGAVDVLNPSAGVDQDTKKSKWPFSKRSMSKGRTADVEKCLASIQIQDWRNTHFQQYKDSTLEEFLKAQPELRAEDDPKAFKSQEALWELFTSECVYFLDHLMVLKEVFLTTLSDLQMRDCLLDIDPWALFANLNELCLVSFGFLTSLLRAVKDLWTPLEPSPNADASQALVKILIKAFGESICHCLQKYCLNYSKALVYLDGLKAREDFGSYVKWCERKEQCRRLQLKDLLVVPLQRFTRYPLLLKNMASRSCTETEEEALQSVVQLVDRSIYDLEGKVKWLDNYQKVKQLKEALVWPAVWERNKRAHVPENLKHLLKAVTLENLVSQRNLLYEGRLTLTENAKLQDVYLFLFDEFLLITKIKRNKKKSVGGETHPLRPAGQELEQLLQEGCSFTVLDQPLSLDRLQLRNIDQLNATATGLPCSFIITHQNRYQQCIGVFILQAHSESVKKAWLSEIEDAVDAQLTQGSHQPRMKSSSLYLESSQI